MDGQHERQQELIEKWTRFKESCGDQFKGALIAGALKARIIDDDTAVELATGSILSNEVNRGDREP